MKANSNPIVIIGAGRSGTNMLRDILVQVPGLVTWPCDEINYIWRHGNRSFPTDEFTRAMATPEISRFIQRQFSRLSDNQVIVEKTCANSLRVEFVDQVLPNARFINIVRDGRDVCVSAEDRWTASLDVGYILKKAKYVPLSDLPYYAGSYFMNRVRRLFAVDKRLAVWGPKFSGMETAFRQNPLPVACAIQWQACVRASQRQLAQIDPKRVLELRYEDFVSSPTTELDRILGFLEVDGKDLDAASLVGGVSKKSVGRWQSKLQAEHIAQIEQVVGDTLLEQGYSLSKKMKHAPTETEVQLSTPQGK